jgi:hypothetical protein
MSSNITDGLIPCVTVKRPIMGSETDVVVLRGDDREAFFRELPTFFSRLENTEFDLAWLNPETDELTICGRYRDGQRSFRIDGVNREEYFDQFCLGYLGIHYKDPQQVISWADLEQTYTVKFMDPTTAAPPNRFSHLTLVQEP